MGSLELLLTWALQLVWLPSPTTQTQPCGLGFGGVGEAMWPSHLFTTWTVPRHFGDEDLAVILAWADGTLILNLLFLPKHPMQH